MLDYLPRNLHLHILKRLPLTSIIQCSTVCKSWNSFLTSNHFISAYQSFYKSINANRAPKLLLSISIKHTKSRNMSREKTMKPSGCSFLISSFINMRPRLHILGIQIRRRLRRLLRPHDSRNPHLRHPPPSLASSINHRNLQRSVFFSLAAMNVTGMSPATSRSGNLSLSSPATSLSLISGDLSPSPDPATSMSPSSHQVGGGVGGGGGCGGGGCGGGGCGGGGSGGGGGGCGGGGGGGGGCGGGGGAGDGGGCGGGSGGGCGIILTWQNRSLNPISKLEG
ncbi:hypothetical protein OSB04_021826 [Centaurea solstitialis]|uniref:F-box domain-containing protein n=1 Tax=Centaurea solstitialis TaxID=347529 RepID=A0AA38SV74_9ASTR|nr:hypothetical protein OSB04_021826 [Centaurea solstitialis]